jgi:hypothetical protein
MIIENGASITIDIPNIIFSFKHWEDAWPNIWNFLLVPATFLAAVTTIIAVITAWKLKSRQIRKNLPMLSLNISNEDERCFEYVSTDSGLNLENGAKQKKEELWLKMFVSNSGNTAAKDVQIRLRKTLRDGRTDPQSRSNMWFKVSNLKMYYINMLPRNIDQPFDLAFVSRTCGDTKDKEFIHYHMGLVQPELDKDWEIIRKSMEENKENKLDVSFVYTIEVAVLSSNADAIIKRIELHLPDIKIDSMPDNYFGKENLRKYMNVKAYDYKDNSRNRIYKIRKHISKFLSPRD